MTRTEIKQKAKELLDNTVEIALYRIDDSFECHGLSDDDKLLVAEEVNKQIKRVREFLGV